MSAMPLAQRGSSRCAEASRRCGLAASAAALLPGCTLAPGADHDGDDAPQALRLARPVLHAWVFSSGGPRGFTHVGVLRALHEMGLAPDLIVGASVGALIGGLRASGVDAPAIEALALALQPMALARVAFGAEERLSGAPLAELMRPGTLERIADVPIYAVDPIVRRAPALQRTADARPPAVGIASELAAERGIVDGTPVRVSQGGAHVVLPARVDASLAANVIRVAAGHALTAALGPMFGTLAIDVVAGDRGAAPASSREATPS